MRHWSEFGGFCTLSRVATMDWGLTDRKDKTTKQE